MMGSDPEFYDFLRRAFGDADWESMDREGLSELAASLGLPDIVTESLFDRDLIARAVMNARRMAMESASNVSAIPDDIGIAASMFNLETGETVSAFNLAATYSYVPSFIPKSWGPAGSPQHIHSSYDWSMRSLSGKTRPRDPKRIRKIVRSWLVIGPFKNAVSAQNWFRSAGFPEASAESPIAVSLREATPEETRYVIGA